MMRGCLRLMPLISLGSSALGCGFGWQPSFDEAVDGGSLQTVQIAETSSALTFARYESAGEQRLLLVQSYERDVVRGVDVTLASEPPSRDPIQLFELLGYERLAELADGELPSVEVSAAALGLPVDLGEHHIAAGTNYAEHAGEVGTQGTPYLFPKLVAPTPWNADVSVRQALLDYEVELSFVTLEPTALGERPAFMGVMVCNDYTDRATLLRNLDVDDVESGKGFTTGKSFPGYLPVGGLFVIPKDYRAFARDVQLQLSVNGQLRQRESVSAAIWDIDEIFDQIEKRARVTWEHRGQRVSLLSRDDGFIDERVMIMTGTPHGVVFNEVTTEQKASGFFGWLLGGWGDSIPDHAIEAYITDAKGEGIYLLTDDRVDIHVEGLGVVRNRIVP